MLMVIHNYGASMKFLVIAVDDSKFIHKIIGNFLDPKRFEVHFFVCAKDAKKALDAFARQGRDVDLVLLDIYLQEGTKEDSLRLLHFLTREKKRTHVILMSGRLSAREFVEFYLRGAANYLLKPFAEKKFIYTVQRHVKLARSTPEYNNKPLAKVKINEREIFIGALSAHAQIASFLRDELMKNNIGSCCEPAEFLGDTLWRAVLTHAINRCKIFFLILTPDTLQSAYMKQEIVQAFKRKKRDGNKFFIIPILYNIQASSLPRQLSSLYCVDITSAKNRAENIRSLIFSVKKKMKTMV